MGDWMSEYMAGLIGSKIVGAGVRELGGVVMPYFEALTPDGTKLIVEVSQDEEGNGPGFLFGLPIRTEGEG